MPSVPAAMWYVMVGDTETGPLTRVDVGVEAASGAIDGETLVWREGMADWVPGAKVPELAQLFLNPPKSPRGKPPPPPRPKKHEKGTGMSDFDTAAFKLADLAAQKELAGDSGLKRDIEFDTAHFRLAELGKSAPKGKGGDRLAVPRRITPKAAEGPLELDAPAKPGKKSAPRQASTAAAKPAEQPQPVKSVRPATPPRPSAPAQPPPPPVAFDPNRTSVDFRTLGALVHDQQSAQARFEKELAPDAQEVEPEQGNPGPHAAELSKWAADQIAEEAKAHPKEDLAAKLKARALAKQPPPVGPIDEPKGPSVWLYVGIGGGILAALAFVAFLLWD